MKEKLFMLLAVVCMLLGVGAIVGINEIDSLFVVVLKIVGAFIFVWLFGWFSKMSERTRR